MCCHFPISGDQRGRRNISIREVFVILAIVTLCFAHPTPAESNDIIQIPTLKNNSAARDLDAIMTTYVPDENLFYSTSSRRGNMWALGSFVTIGSSFPTAPRGPLKDSLTDIAVIVVDDVACAIDSADRRRRTG